MRLLLQEAVDALDNMVLRIGLDGALPAETKELVAAEAVLAKFRTEIEATAERQP